MEDTKFVKKGFFKKVWYSIFKLEKYGEMAAEGVPRAIFYTIKLAIIISIVTAICTIYVTNKSVQKGKDIIENQIGEFSYNDGVLDVVGEEPIKIEITDFGEIIINTKIETDEDVNQVLNSIQTSRGIVFSKDKLTAKGITSKGLVIYKYSDLVNGTGLQEFNKQDVLNLFSGDNLRNLYIAVAIIIAITMIISFTLQFLWYNILLSLFGYITTYFAKIKMRFAAVFNMACYAFTLSILLQTIYIVINVFWNFEIKYFTVMYIAVAAIYLIAAIFLIRTEFLKQQIEASKIVAIKKQEEKEQQNENEEKQDEEDGKTQEPKENNKENKNENNKDKNGAEPEGSEA